MHTHTHNLQTEMKAGGKSLHYFFYLLKFLTPPNITNRYFLYKRIKTVFCPCGYNNKNNNTSKGKLLILHILKVAFQMWHKIKSSDVTGDIVKLAI